MAAIKQESLFRNLATDIQVYDHDYRIKTVNTEDVAVWVPEGGTIPLSDGMGDFSDITLASHKVAVFLKLEDTLVRDPFFKIEDYLVKRLAKNFGQSRGQWLHQRHRREYAHRHSVRARRRRDWCDHFCTDLR